MNKLERLYNFCSLLKIECFKEELNSYLNGYTIIEEQEGQRILECTISNANGDRISLSYENGCLSLFRVTKNFVDRVNMYRDLSITERHLEKRQNGIVVTDIKKQFAQSKKFKNKVALVDLEEIRYVFTKETIERILKNVDFEKDNPTRLLLRLRQLELHSELENHCELSTRFSTHMKYYFPWDGVRLVSSTIYSNHTYLNGEDISHLYDIVEGPDKLYRIYDLYRGIINQRNASDIHSIHLGLLSPKCFDLTSLCEISQSTDELIGQASSISEEYSNYLKQLFKNKYKYEAPIIFNRDFILNILLATPLPSLETKKDSKPKLPQKRALRYIFRKNINN